MVMEEATRDKGEHTSNFSCLPCAIWLISFWPKSCGQAPRYTRTGDASLLFGKSLRRGWDGNGGPNGSNLSKVDD